jgi:hypothetical protein
VEFELQKIQIWMHCNKNTKYSPQGMPTWNAPTGHTHTHARTHARTLSLSLSLSLSHLSMSRSNRTLNGSLAHTSLYVSLACELSHVSRVAVADDVAMITMVPTIDDSSVVRH